MSVPDIISSMAQGWHRDPAGQLVGTERTGLSAALWTHDDDCVQEVWADPSPNQHLISIIGNRSFQSETFVDGKVRYAKRLAPGDINIIRAGERPRSVARGRWHVLHVYIPVQMIAEILTAENHSSRPGEVELIDPNCERGDLVIGRTARSILSEMRSEAPFSRLRADALGQEMIVQLLRSHSSLANRNSWRAPKGLAAWQIKRVLDLMCDRLANDLSVADLAATVSLSPHHFSRCFKASTGLPPHAWQQRCRLQRAQDLMLGSDEALAAIATATGCASQQHFTTAFKRHIGATPAAWRRERRD